MSSEPDLAHYGNYRDTEEDFVPGPLNLDHTTADTFWTDDIPEGWMYYYKITAVDDAGNESGPSVPETVAGGDVPHAPRNFALYQNVPNPFNPTTMIRFDLPRAVHVKLCVYSVAGELIATLVCSSA